MTRWLWRVNPADWARVLLLTGVLCLGPSAWAAEPEDSAAAPKEPAAPEVQAAPEVPAQNFLPKRMEAARDLYGNTVKAIVVKAVVVERSPPTINLAFLLGMGLLVTGLLTAGVLGLRTFAPRVPASTSVPQVLTEDESYANFEQDFQINSLAASAYGSGTGRIAHFSAGGNRRDNLILETDPLIKFLADAPLHIRQLRKLLQEIGRQSDGSKRQKILIELGAQIHRLKGTSQLPELVPILQMASALDALIGQLTEKHDRATPSNLRTVASALDLLEELCRPGLPADLSTNPPIRLLAVDDEALSRHAISFALKKGVNPPDLAEDGSSALKLASKENYDVIFLDVQMPGLDGFELCSRIHETGCNRTTPVVFVTLNSDFNARAKSTLSGGSDLIAKPFLTSEITVKALTLALRKRLQDRSQLPLENPDAARTQAKPASTEPTHSRGRARANSPAAPAAMDLAAHTPGPSGRSSASPNTAFFTQASTKLHALQKIATTVSLSLEWEVRQQALTDLYLQLHTLTSKPDFMGLSPAVRLSASLEGLLKKLLESPQNSTPSTLLTVTTAVDLLSDLCAKKIRTDLATTPPFRLLVVDDDPIARRVLGSGLQMAFNNPETAEDGEAALALAEQKTYDVIFLDVEMPGMDGYTVCTKLRETAANSQTPVVFVTSHSDLKSRKKSSLSGGSDFISKPFLASEITVKALTLALRRRLEAQRDKENMKETTRSAGPLLVV